MDKALITHAQQFIMSGPARMLAANGLNVNSLRTNEILRKEEWQLLDTALVGVARQRLIGINDLVARGLSFNLGGLGIVLSQYEKLGDMSAADVDFAGVTEGEKDAVTFTLASVPVPIFHKDFSINLRRLEASRGTNAVGAAIDATRIETAGQKVVEQMEEVLFNGTSIGKVQSGGGVTTQNQLFGYTDQTNINTYSGGDWATVTNPQIDIIAAIDKVESDKYFGPWVVYVATTQYGQLRSFLTDGSGDQVFDRVKRIQGVEDIRPGDRLTAGTAVLVTMRRDVVDVAIGQDLTVVEWESKGGFMLNYKVLAALAPRVKDDAATGSGITKLTGI